MRMRDKSQGDILTLDKRGHFNFALTVLGLRLLAQSKLNTFVGTSTREKARDLYDAAWLMENHFESIVPNQRIGLWKALDGPLLEKAGEWRGFFSEDDIMSRASFDDTCENLSASLDCDPMVLWHQDPQGTFALESRNEQHILISSSGTFRGQVIGEFEDRTSAERWLRQIDPERRLPPLQESTRRNRPASVVPKP